MPTAPRAGCPVGLCAEIVVPGTNRCSGHALEPQRARYDDDRGNSADRGYDATWKKFRLLILHRDPICKACGLVPSTEVDHIAPLAQGGARLDKSNCQGLCKVCHSTKTAQEDGGFGRPAIARALIEDAAAGPARSSESSSVAPAPRGESKMRAQAAFDRSPTSLRAPAKLARGVFRFRGLLSVRRAA